MKDKLDKRRQETRSNEMKIRHILWLLFAWLLLSILNSILGKLLHPYPTTVNIIHNIFVLFQLVHSKSCDKLVQKYQKKQHRFFYIEFIMMNKFRRFISFATCLFAPISRIVFKFMHVWLKSIFCLMYLIEKINKDGTLVD